MTIICTLVLSFPHTPQLESFHFKGIFLIPRLIQRRIRNRVRRFAWRYSYCTETDIIDKHRFPMGSVLLPPATKLQQGYVFTPVCHSVHRGVSATLPPPGWTSPSQTPPVGRHLPAQCMLALPSACWDTHPTVQCMLGYGQQAGGTHPTGMHTCFTSIYVCLGVGQCKRTIRYP